MSSSKGILDDTSTLTYLHLRDTLASRPLDRHFRSLTQVNRQTRSEFLPIYQANTTYRLSHFDIPLYLNAALNAECLRKAHKHISGLQADCIDLKRYYLDLQYHETEERKQLTRNLIVDCISLRERPGHRPTLTDNSTTDILPFLNFLAAAPNVHVKCGIAGQDCRMLDWNGLRGILDALFDIARRPRLRAWIEKNVSHVLLLYAPFISIWMREGCGVEWMRRWMEEGFTEHDVKKKAWEEEMGLVFEKGLLDSVLFHCHDWVF